MTEVPKFIDLMWPTLKAIQDLGGSASNSEIVDKIIENEKIPESIQNIPQPSGAKSKLEYNMAWSRSYLKAAGAINNSERGIWSITELGATAKPDSMKSLVAKARENSAAGRQTTPNEPAPVDREAEMDSDWKTNLLQFFSNK